MNIRHLVAASLVFLSGYSSANAEQQTIGSIFPLTGDGAFWGTNPKQAIELALGDLEKRGVVPPKVIFEDDHCDPKQAVAAFHKLVEVDRVNIILGPACSSSTLAIVPLAEEKKVVVLAFSEADSIKSGGFVFRVWIPNGFQGRQMAQHIFNERGIKRVAVIANQNAFGADIAEAFRSEFVRLGGAIAGYEDYAPDSKSVRPQLLKLKAAKPEALYFASYPTDGMIVVKEAHELRLNLPLFGASTLDDPAFFSEMKELVEGMTIADIPDLTTPEFRERWKQEFREEWPGMQSGAPLYYDLTTALGEWLNTHSSDSVKAREYLLSLDFKSGASGELRFTGEGNLNRRHSIFIVHDGRLTLREPASR